jgi:hypothetical protein
VLSAIAGPTEQEWRRGARGHWAGVGCPSSISTRDSSPCTIRPNKADRVLNGEIYNYRAIKKDSRRAGHKFRQIRYRGILLPLRNTAPDCSTCFGNVRLCDLGHVEYRACSAPAIGG